MRELGERDEELLLGYLRGATRLWSEMGAADDVLDPEAPVLVGAGSLCTDGTWLWRDDLTYYVGRYHVALPAEFLAHVRRLDHRPPDVPFRRCAEIWERDLGLGSLGVSG
ncbi:hypothetical protein ACGFZL_06470 [Streptomyces sp. NPDC048182]|uniref:hypothetical protein n=1 Tax=Streptomyces sp. NPDC048182 TaxID=3365507 RepID=UPI00371D94B3